MNGLLLKTRSRLKSDEAIVVVLPDAGEKLARVVWTDDDLYGCRFAEPLTSGEISASLLKSEPMGDNDSDDAEPEESFGERLRRLRKGAGIQLTALAAEIGVSKPTLWKWETDKVRPRSGSLARLADALRIDEKALLYGTPEPANSDEATLPNSSSLEDLVSACRQKISDLAGVSSERVKISIDLN